MDMSSLYYQHRHHVEQHHHNEQHRMQQQHLRNHHDQRRQYMPYHPDEQPPYPPSSDAQPQHYYHESSAMESHHHTYQEQSIEVRMESELIEASQQRIQQPDPSLASRDAILDTLLALMRQERTGYSLDNYFPPDYVSTSSVLPRRQNIIHGGWREKICQWSYNVVDHFDLPREIVSISLNFFDRYMATLSAPTCQKTQQGSGDLALLASLGTLHLATKVHATNHNDYDPTLGPLEEQHHKVPSLSTLANLSRGQFGPASILEMEKILLSALQWRLHPPTLYVLVTYLLKLVPTLPEDPRNGIKTSLAAELFEVAMYVAELSVCDAFFVDRQIPSSVIALAAICTAMEDLLCPTDANSMMAGLDPSLLEGSGCFTEQHRTTFLRTCDQQLGLGKHARFSESLDRLRTMYKGAAVANTAESSIPNKSNDEEVAQVSESQPSRAPSPSHQPRSRTNSYNPPTSPSSIADMSLSTINSAMQDMAGTGSSVNASVKRGDSMVSSIAYSLANNSKDTITVDESDDELFGNACDVDDTPGRDSQNNFKYSPSPPRESSKASLYNYNGTAASQPSRAQVLRTNLPTTSMSCSPIVASLR